MNPQNTAVCGSRCAARLGLGAAIVLLVACLTFIVSSNSRADSTSSEGSTLAAATSTVRASK